MTCQAADVQHGAVDGPAKTADVCDEPVRRRTKMRARGRNGRNAGGGGRPATLYNDSDSSSGKVLRVCPLLCFAKYSDVHKGEARRGQGNFEFVFFEYYWNFGLGSEYL